MQKKISFIIPCYNVENTISRCVNSILSQNVDSSCYEIILIEDSSTDETLSVLNHLRLKHNNIIVAEHAVNYKQGAARNTGLRIASGDYILFVDGDDLLMPAVVPALLSKSSEKKYDIITTGIQKIDLEKKEVLGVNSRVKRSTDMVRDALSGGFGFGPCGIFFRREFLESEAILFKPNRYYEDIEFVIESFLKAKTADCLEIPGYLWVVNSQSTTCTISKDKVSHSIDAFVNIFKLLNVEDLISCYSAVWDESFIKFMTLMKERINAISDDGHLMSFFEKYFYDEIIKCVGERKTIKLFSHIKHGQSTFSQTTAAKLDEGIFEFIKSLEKKETSPAPSYAVTVIVPIYNVERYLKKCLQSLISQSLQDIEVIIVDDDSPDSSTKIAAQYLLQNKNFRLVYQNNRGLGGARNTGIRFSNAEYVMFCDSDDWYDERMCEKMYLAVADGICDCAICDVEIVYEEGCPERPNIDKYFKLPKDGINDIVPDTFKLNACAPNKIFKRNLLIDYSLFFVEDSFHEDNSFFFLYLALSDKINFVTDKLYYYLQRNNSIMSEALQPGRKSPEGCFENSSYMVKFIKRNGLYEKIKTELLERVYYLLQTGVIRIKKMPEFEQEYRVRCGALVSQMEFTKEDCETEANFKFLNELKGEALNMLPQQKRKKTLTCVPSPELDILKIRSYKDKFKGERCFIVGNGPSLNKCDLSFLKDEYSFAVNGIFYKTRECGFVPTFYVVEDGHVVNDNLDSIAAYEAPHKFTLALYTDKFDEKSRMQFLTADTGFYNPKSPSYHIPRFSYDASDIVYCGQSVTYINMQLAYYMGFSEVYLIGMDFSYAVPKSTVVEGCNFTSQEDDPNHFHPDYFGKGKKWHDPQLEMVAVNYEKAKEEFDKNGRKIFNATVGGELEIFERVEYDSLFKDRKINNSMSSSFGANEDIPSYNFNLPQMETDDGDADSNLPVFDLLFSFIKHCLNIFKDRWLSLGAVCMLFILAPLILIWAFPDYSLLLSFVSLLSGLGLTSILALSFIGQTLKDSIAKSESKHRREFLCLSSFYGDAINDYVKRNFALNNKLINKIDELESLLKKQKKDD